MPLDIQVIFEMTCWTKKKDPINIACTNADCALRELTLHGRPIFEHGLKKLKAFHEDLDSGWTPETTDYFILRDIVTSSEGYL